MKAADKLGIRGKLLVILLAIGLVPMAVVGVIAYKEASSALGDNAAEEQSEVAFNVSDKLDRNLFERYGDVQAFARSDPARSMEPARLRSWMDTNMGIYAPIYDLMVVADRRGRIVATNTVDLEGAPAGTKDLIGRDVSRDAWFKTTISGQLDEAESLVEDVHQDALMREVYGSGSKSLAMSFSFPIRDDAGQIVGVWTNRFNWAAAEDIVAADLKRVRANGAKTEAVVLRDRRGRVLIPTGGKAETDGKVSESFRSTGFSTYPGLGWSVLATQDESEALGAATDLRNQMLAIALLVALLIGAIAYLIARAVARRVGEYAGFAGRVATGDLSARLSVNGSSDELATLGIHLNDMVDGLARVSGQVQEGAQAITASTNEIVAAVNQQTASATEQSAAITQTSTSVEEIRVAAEQAAMKAEEVARQAETSVEVGDEGGRAVEAIASGMTDIQDRVDAIAQDILALSERTQQIGEITRTVNDLADQSNLLAFNATIEAAKAGEQGKGFAVVADEVRNLAEQSKQATAQVQAILGEIQKATNAAVMAAEQGTTTVQAGTERAERAGEVIAQLADVNREAAQAAQQIAALARQQNAGMDQIAQAMGETSQATTQFVAGARESQTAAGHLDQVARELNEMAAAYKI